jgi:hypothetical protein
VTDTLSILQSLHVIRQHGNQYVNLDISTREGVAKAQDLNLAKSGVADVVISSSLYGTSQIFTPRNKGVAFGLFRHPIDRAVSMFYYLKNAPNDPGYRPIFANMTLEDYARLGYAENNWLTRFLSNKLGGRIQQSDFDLAKEIISTKFVVGLLSDFKTSLSRFEDYFGWKDRVKDYSQTEQCIDKWIAKGENRHDHPIVEQGTAIWDSFLQHNRYDTELFEHIFNIFTKHQT